VIRARTSNGWFILGLDAENVRRMKAGEPIKVDLTVHGGKDTVIILYGDDKEEIYKTLEDISGAPLPPAQVMPPTEGG
jgi:hypothetical protein